MTTLIASEKDKFLLNMEGQDFSHEAKTFIKLRERALENLKEQEFPTTKQEEWKYTSVKEISKKTYRPQSPINIKASDVQPFLIPNLSAITLVFVNGFYQENLSKYPEELPEGLKICSLNEAKKEHLSLVESHLDTLSGQENLFFANINTAYSQDGGFVHISKGAKIKTPIHLVFLTEGEEVSSQPRTLIIAEKNSQAELLATYQTISSQSSFTNAVTEVFVGDGANLTINKIQNEHANSFNISFERAKVGKDATFSINTVPASGKLVRNNVHVTLNGSGGTANLYGAICINKNMHVDNQTFVEHKVANCQSNEMYKSVVSDEATAVFNGKILVKKDAQKTNAFQNSANILMADTAKVYAKPQLEIYADDVKCSHGCTIGQFDNEALFYLRARGIKESVAKKVLLEAFIGEVIDHIENEAIRAKVETLLQNNFN